MREVLPLQWESVTQSGALAEQSDRPSGYTVEKVPPPEWNSLMSSGQTYLYIDGQLHTSFCIPDARQASNKVSDILKLDHCESGGLPFFGTQEILAIRQKHIFNTWLQNDRAHWSFLASSVPAPATVRSNG